MRNLTCWAISFDKQSVSGIWIVESDIASEQIRSQMQNDLFIISENTKENRESNERRPTSPLHVIHSGEVHPSSPN